MVRWRGGRQSFLGVGIALGFETSLHFQKVTKQNILQKDEAVSLQLKIPLPRASAHQLLN